MIKILEAKNNEFYFVIKAGNGKVIATSETYKRKRDCLKSAKLVQGLSKEICE